MNCNPLNWIKAPHKVTVEITTDGLFFWHEKGRNGEIVCHSEVFAGPPQQSLDNARKAAREHCKAKRVYSER